MTPKHLAIIQALRKDARATLADINRETGIPTSTLFDYYRQLAAEVILKHTTLLDFSALQYSIRKQFLLRAKERKEAFAWLRVRREVNNLVRLDSFDVSFDAYFRNVAEVEAFKEALERKLAPRQVREFDLLETLKEESFIPTSLPGA